VTRPAFYALPSGGWRDYVTLLHPPYTAWHLSYVAIGAALAPELHSARLLASLAAFFLALGIGAHALDELQGRPLRTQIPTRVFWALALVPIAGAVAIGVIAALAWTAWLLLFVIAGAFLVFAYNLELFGGRFHTDLWFALAWGAFPLLTGYFALAEKLTLEALLAAGFAVATSLAQRILSTQVRGVRRGRIDEPVSSIVVPEQALRALTFGVVALAAALLALRW
jgi:heme O synthase-like polyprenyltransferase